MYTLLLADDELHTRRGILKNMDWQTIGIGTVLEAGDGRVGLALAGQHKIDIVLSDIRMPKMNGIEMAEAIRRIYPDCVILFLSGYSDKEYLRSAISLHALHYIDKPVQRDQLSHALKDAAAFCDSLRGSTGQSRRMKESRLTRLLCTPGPDEKKLSSLLAECGRSPAEFSDSRTIVIQLLASGQASDTALTVSQVLSHSQLPHLISDYHEQTVIVHLLSGRERQVSSLTRIFLENLSRRISCALADSSHFISVGVLAGNLHEVYLSYQSSAIGLQKNFFLGRNSVSFSDDPLPPVFTPEEDFYRMLLNSALHEGEERCLAMLDRIFTGYRDHPAALVSVVRESYYNILSQLSRYCINHGIGLPSGSRRQLWDIVSSASTLQELHNHALNLYRSFFAALKAQSGPRSIADQVRSVVAARFGSPSLDIRYISSSLGFSPSYLCSLFKQETGKTLNQYIIQYRIGEASRLLLETDKKISEVAILCGFSDHNYFTKLFKKWTGLTPTEYRGIQARSV